ncbi:hypothetical protein [Treponema sp.]|uniref:hypothetical protein n=1 Tax=Treponema sp. TaxID=166 RepID=UPI00298DB404|nr:hypothetical protein [Treponema sp.]MCQ2240595.1 hypothetical protein [Treponema sp.]
MKRWLIVFLCAASLFISSCSKERTINLNSSDSLSITPDQEWAVIKVPYAAFLESCDYSSSVKTHARSGDIFLVKGKEFVKKTVEDTGNKRRKKIVEEFETWYKFEEGCLSSSLIDIYDTKLKATSASEKLKKN